MEEGDPLGPELKIPYTLRSDKVDRRDKVDLEHVQCLGTPGAWLGTIALLNPLKAEDYSATRARVCHNEQCGKQ